MPSNRPTLLRYAAILAVLGGILRVATPHAAPANKGGDTSTKAETSTSRHTSSYEIELERTVYQFFGKERTDQKIDPNQRWSEIKEEGKNVQFVFAILPDPVHTHLGLLFDRGIGAIQLAAQQKRYVFDRAILPWDRGGHRETDPQKRVDEIEAQRLRESWPGLMIFRGGSSSAAAPDASPHPPLFVLIVGETPTGGVRRLQFKHAIDIARSIRGGAFHAGEPFNILGPSFSGSLASLDQAVDEATSGERSKSDNKPLLDNPYVFSGSVTDKGSIDWFEGQRKAKGGRFASFQQNDHYVVQRFVDFLCAQRYDIDEIAELSEDSTVYGAGAGDASGKTRDSGTFSCFTDRNKRQAASATRKSPLVLHFPREISFFRSAYQKATAEQSQQEKASPGRTTLNLELEDTGSDDDTVAPYGGTLTPLSQEAVMLGIASELTKHHIKFVILFATDPVDQLFLARYLRSAYPEGRVIVTVPDLLFDREVDGPLHGVLAINTYALVPGLNDDLCQQSTTPIPAPAHEHSDRLFSSSTTVGIFNAMLGLLSRSESDSAELLPAAHYVQYAGLRKSGPDGCKSPLSPLKPLTWLTILGQDGFWPVAPLDSDPLTTEDQLDDSLRAAASFPGAPLDDTPNTPDVWYTIYCVCLLLMTLHALLSWTGSALDDSEWGAQFARSNDNLTAYVIGAGALVLTIAMVALLCARSPLLQWKAPTYFAPWFWTFLLWLPVPAFLFVTLWDLGRLRSQRQVPIVFSLSIAMVSFFLFFFDLPPRSHIYWLPRVVHLSSTVSPVVPFLLLLAGGYWWMWHSLRGVTLVDLRRPRLPLASDLPPECYRISDAEAEALRETAHPFFFQWQVYIPVAILVPFACTAVDFLHPVQTIEGFAYDAGYSALLLIMLASFLGVLVKLVRTWFACRQILGGLDRLTLRHAFSRMTDISWKSLWNPGGTTLRETYKLLMRALDNLDRLRKELPKSLDREHPLSKELARVAALKSCAYEIYGGLHPGKGVEINYEELKARAEAAHLKVEPIRNLYLCERKRAEAERILMGGIEALQRSMAKTAALVITSVLAYFWGTDRSPVVSIAASVENPDGAKKSTKEKESEEDEGAPAGEPLPLLRALAEEYVALIYVNFLITVLLRVRTMILSAIGLYVFLVLSMNAYPFEPHPALQSLSVILIVLMGLAVGYVYAQMHRDPILSRLTSTKPGELGWDFWLKLGSAAAIPLFSLLATQFPEIGQIFNSWLQPALEAVK
jgi:hypothetical protein